MSTEKPKSDDNVDRGSTSADLQNSDPGSEGDMTMDQMKKYVDKGNADILAQFSILKDLIIQGQQGSSGPSGGSPRDHSHVTSPGEEREQSHFSEYDPAYSTQRRVQSSNRPRAHSPPLSIHAGRDFEDSDDDNQAPRHRNLGKSDRSKRDIPAALGAPPEDDTGNEQPLAHFRIPKINRNLQAHQVGSEREGSPARSVSGSVDQNLSESSEYVPSDEWNGILVSVARELGCPVPEPKQQEENKSYISSPSFTSNQHKVVELPLEGLCKDAFDILASKGSRRVPLYKLQTKKDFRNSEEDYDKYLCTPRMEKAAETRIRNDSYVTGKSIYNETERRADNELFDIDKCARIGLASTSHLTLLLAYLDKRLHAEETIDASVFTTLGYAVNSAVASFDQFARVCLRSVVARRKIALNNMKLPDGQLKDALLDIPLHGNELFGGKFAEKTREHAQILQDMRTTSEKEMPFKGQKRPAPKGPENPKKKQFTKNQQGSRTDYHYQGSAKSESAWTGKSEKSNSGSSASTIFMRKKNRPYGRTSSFRKF